MVDMPLKGQETPKHTAPNRTPPRFGLRFPGHVQPTEESIVKLGLLVGEGMEDGKQKPKDGVFERHSSQKSHPFLRNNRRLVKDSVLGFQTFLPLYTFVFLFPKSFLTITKW